jgi:hypothetical protein
MFKYSAPRPSGAYDWASTGPVLVHCGAEHNAASDARDRRPVGVYRPLPRRRPRPITGGCGVMADARRTATMACFLLHAGHLPVEHAGRACALLGGRGNVGHSSSPYRTGLNWWVTPCGPAESPAMTRLSSRGPGQAKEATTLIGSPRPTSACFLSADLLNPRLQTRFGKCTKRAGEPALPINLAEGSAEGTSALCRYPGGRKANGCLPPYGGTGGRGAHLDGGRSIPLRTEGRRFLEVFL